MKYFLMPYGCQMNRSDSERIRTVLNGIGLVEAPDEEDPSIAVKGIVSCSVRQTAIDRVYGKIRNWNLEKTRRPFITFITGCVLPADREKFLKIFDIVFPIESLPDLPDMIHQYGVPTGVSLETQMEGSGRSGFGVPGASHGDMEIADRLAEGTAGLVELHPFRSSTPESPSGTPRQGIDAFWKVNPSYRSRVEAYVPIQNGCDKFCSFCAVPYTRGREVSRSSSEILDEVRRLVDDGCRSITLLGQNVNSYGLDRSGVEIGFPDLLGKIGEIGRVSGRQFWTYFTSPHPRDMTPQLLEVIAQYDVLADWIHLPLQSGDDHVLLRMNRNHSMDRYRNVVEGIRAILPNATLFTDIIVGFSGESENQFENTIRAMREFRYDMAYIARYSPRPGAVSARWNDDVPATEKERRYRILSDLLEEIALERNADRIGRRMKVLVTSHNRRTGFLSGHTEGRIPVRFRSDTAAVGDFVDVDITSCRPLSLEGRPVPPGGVRSG